MSNWYAGNNSTNNGSFGWLFTPGPIPVGVVVLVTGVQATGQVGTATVGNGITIIPTGVQALGLVGYVNVWGLVPNTQNPNWTDVVDTQTSGWIPVPTVQGPNWTQVIN